MEEKREWMKERKNERKNERRMEREREGYQFMLFSLSDPLTIYTHCSNWR